jgi:hypothetical protein
MAISKTKRVTLKRVMWAFIPAILLLAFGIVMLDGYLIYSICHPHRTPLYGSPRDFQIILQKPMWSEEKWKNSDGTSSTGWFLSRGQTAPAIIISHGYGSNRSDLLTLGFELWKAGYHVLLYDLRGHGESPVKWSGIGTYEKEDLLSAIGFLKSLKTETGQDLTDGRIGLYGVDLGGYISLVAAAQSPLVKAVAADSVYPDISYFIKHRFRSYTGREDHWANKLVDSPFATRLTAFLMQAYLMRREDSSSALESISVPSGKKLLFIAGKDGGALEATTREMYKKAAEPKQLVEVEKARINRLYDEHSATYDARVVAFFREAMPISLASQKPTRK